MSCQGDALPTNGAYAKSISTRRDRADERLDSKEQPLVSNVDLPPAREPLAVRLLRSPSAAGRLGSDAERGGAGRRGIEGAPPQEPLDRRKRQEDEIQRERELESSSHLVEKAAACEREANHLRHEEGRLEVRAGHSA